MCRHKDLQAANRARRDEFYTQLDDIAKELQYYTEHFRGKTVLCNCDDPYESNFFKYFAMNFYFLGLKKLICTCWHKSPIVETELHFSDEQNELELAAEPTIKTSHGSKIELTEILDLNNDGAIDLDDVKLYLERHKPEMLMGTGDFRSFECIELLKEADIVVTNPPFSLFREYMAQLVAYDKKFIIIGNVNAISYKEIFPMIKANKLWLGPSITSGDRKFNVPDYYELNAAGCGIDENGRKYIRVKGVRWFTNLDHKKRHQKFDLYKNYTPEEYPKYDYYDVINVNVTAKIPMDYDGVMGVPITFLDKYCPEQFEIVDLPGIAISGLMNNPKDTKVNGKSQYARILIRAKK